MAKSPTYQLTPAIYEIGVDISTERWTEIILAVGDWFRDWRPDLREPNVAARQALECCLKGVKPSDPTQQWKGMETGTLKSRIRVACQFDIDDMQPLRSKRKRMERRQDETADKAKQKAKTERAAKKDDALIPDELRKELRANAKYGDDPRVFLSSEEAAQWQELHDEYVKAFPELATVNAAAELDQLCDHLIVAGRHRMKLLKGDRVELEDQASTTKQIIELKKALGIHPDQLQKRVQQKTAGTLGEYVRRMDELDEQSGRELRAKFWLEELLMLWQMYQVESPRGRQLDDVGFFGMTRCRSCECATCGTRNVAGFAVTEVEAYLIRQGVLEPIPERDASASDDATASTAPAAPASPLVQLERAPAVTSEPATWPIPGELDPSDGA